MYVNKVYNLNPEGTKLVKFTTDSEKKIVLNYKPKPRLRILNEDFLISDYPIRGIKAGGIRLASRELQTCKIT